MWVTNRLLRIVELAASGVTHVKLVSVIPSKMVGGNYWISKVLDLYLFFSRESDSRIANVCPSVHQSVHHKNPSSSQNCSYQPSSLSTIEPIDHQAYWPSSLSTIKPDHQAHWPSSQFTSGLFFATFKPLGFFLLIMKGLKLFILSTLFLWWICWPNEQYTVGTESYCCCCYAVFGNLLMHNWPTLLNIRYFNIQ